MKFAKAYKNKFPKMSTEFFHESAHIIQGDAGEKVNSLGSDSISHFEERVHMYVCLILNGYLDRAV
jgi:hypothetical protein